MPHRYRHISLGETPSTNAEALAFAQNGDAGNLWVTAKRQLKGKGSRGRGWESPVGNLYSSLLLSDPGPAEALGELAFVAALAVHRAINAADGSSAASLSLKWPNDVLINGAKCSGILLESHMVERARFVIIGIGLNVKTFPQDTAYPATSLQKEGINADVDTVFENLKASFAHYLDVWNKGANFEAIRLQWLGLAHGLGKTIDVKLPSGEVETGNFKTIDERGLLILEKRGGGSKSISVADLFFDRPKLD